MYFLNNLMMWEKRHFKNIIEIDLKLNMKSELLGYLELGIDEAFTKLRQNLNGHLANN